MDWERYERDKQYAGALKASMLRRRIGHDYTSRRIYLITKTIEGRRPLLGTLAGDVNAEKGSRGGPHVQLTELGKAVAHEWVHISDYYPEVRSIALQIMPDHLHGILFVTEKIEKHLGTVIKGFKTGTNRHYRRLVLGLSPDQQPPSPGQQPPSTQSTDSRLPAQQGGAPRVGCAATQSRPNQPNRQEWRKRDRSLDSKTTGMLWSLGYNDHILSGEGELKRWCEYLDDNPRRLALRRAFPDYFRVQFGLEVAGQTYSAIGNRFLLSYPTKVQVQLSRSLTELQIEEQVQYFLALARKGAVLVSPAISRGEQRVMRAALDAKLPLIFITPWGFNSFSKPGHIYYEACCEGRFLILAPWPHENRRVPLTRLMCMELNTMTLAICQV